MAETHAVSGLKAKKEEIRCRISELENDIKACRSDLVTISEALRIMGDEDYAKPEALFGRGELAKIIFDALRDAPDGLEIKALADVVMKANGYAAEDRELYTAVLSRVGHAMYRYLHKGQVSKRRMRDGTRVWRLA
jgi:hypothetical protein